MIQEKIQTKAGDVDTLREKMRNANQALVDLVEGLWEKAVLLQDSLKNAHDEELSAALEAEMQAKVNEIKENYQAKYGSVQNNIETLRSVIEELKKEEKSKLISVEASFAEKMSALAGVVDEETYAEMQRELSSTMMQYNSFSASLRNLDVDYQPRALKVDPAVLEPKAPSSKSARAATHKQEDSVGASFEEIKIDESINQESASENYRSVKDWVLEVSNQHPGRSFTTNELTALIRSAGRKCHPKDIGAALRDFEKDGRVAHEKSSKTWQFVPRSAKKKITV